MKHVMDTAPEKNLSLYASIPVVIPANVDKASGLPEDDFH